MRARAMVVVTSGPFCGRRGRASASLIADSSRARVELEGDWEASYRLFERSALREIEPAETVEADARIRECAECEVKGCLHGAVYARVIGKRWAAVCLYHMIRPDGKGLGGAA